MSTGLTIMLGIVLGLAIICISAIVIISLLFGGFGKKRQGAEAEDIRLAQEINRKLSKLEERIDSVETIIFENKKGSK